MLVDQFFQVAFQEGEKEAEPPNQESGVNGFEK